MFYIFLLEFALFLYSYEISVPKTAVNLTEIWDAFLTVQLFKY